MTEKPDSISILLDLVEAIGGQKRDIAHLLDDSDEAKTSRRGLHERQQAIEQQLAKVVTTIERITPIVDELQASRLRATGWFDVVVWIKGAIIGMVSSAATLFFHWWFSK